jgi:sulfur-carrier protein adenylyltransferase/sulfurtransferase
VTSLPPLVQPGPPLTPAQLERYSRHVLLAGIGDVGQRRLAAARVAVLGAGGLGSPVLTYLAAAGVGTLGVVDSDVVDASNLQRQTLFSAADVGRPKVAAAAGVLRRQNPEIDVVEHPVRLTAGTVVDTLTGYDLVIDGTDNFATRYLIADACSQLELPCVWGSVLEFAGQVSVFWPGHGPEYRDVYPSPPPAGSVPSCAEAGVLGAVCAVVGSTMAVEAVKLICGVGEPLVGRLLTYDALTTGVRTIPVRRDPARSAPAPPPPAAAPIADVRPGADAPDDVTPAELSALLGIDRPPVVVDIRESAELSFGMLPGARTVSLADIVSGRATEELRSAARRSGVVLYCKTGARSRVAVDALRAAGVNGVSHLAGGIVGWRAEVDPTLPRY